MFNTSKSARQLIELINSVADEPSDEEIDAVVAWCRMELMRFRRDAEFSKLLLDYKSNATSVRGLPTPPSIVAYETILDAYTTYTQLQKEKKESSSPGSLWQRLNRSLQKQIGTLVKQLKTVDKQTSDRSSPSSGGRPLSEEQIIKRGDITERAEAIGAEATAEELGITVADVINIRDQHKQWLRKQQRSS